MVLTSNSSFNPSRVIESSMKTQKVSLWQSLENLSPSGSCNKMASNLGQGWEPTLRRPQVIPTCIKIVVIWQIGSVTYRLVNFTDIGKIVL